MVDGQEVEPSAVVTVENEVVHLRCFAHSLQLVVRDRLNQKGTVKTMYKALAKASKLTTLLHTSGVVKVSTTNKYACHGTVLLCVKVDGGSMLGLTKARACFANGTLYV